MKKFNYCLILVYFLLIGCKSEPPKTYEIEIIFCDRRAPEKITVTQHSKPSSADILIERSTTTYGGQCSCLRNSITKKYLNVCDIKVIREFYKEKFV